MSQFIIGFSRSDPSYGSPNFIAEIFIKNEKELLSPTVTPVPIQKRDPGTSFHNTKGLSHEMDVAFDDMYGLFKARKPGLNSRS